MEQNSAPIAGAAHLDRAIDRLHGLTAFAAALGRSQQTCSNWRRRGVPEEACIEVEWLTDAKVTCEQLRSDTPWTRIRDKRWPHPKGRPVVDPVSRWSFA